MNVTDLKHNEAIHCQTPEEALIICTLMKEVGLTWLGNNSDMVRNTHWDAYNEKTCYFPATRQYGSTDSASIVFEASRFYNPNTPMKKQQIIKRGQLVALRTKSTCNIWEEKIDKYLKTTYQRDDSFDVVISDEDIKYALQNASPEQKEFLKKAGLELPEIIEVSSLKDGEALEATTDNGDVKYVFKLDNDGFIYFFDSGGIRSVKITSDIKGVKLPKGTKLEITTK